MMILRQLWWQCRCVVVAFIFSAIMASGASAQSTQAAPGYQFTVTEQQLLIIGKALDLLPHGEASGTFNSLQAQIQAQNEARKTQSDAAQKPESSR